MCQVTGRVLKLLSSHSASHPAASPGLTFRLSFCPTARLLWHGLSLMAVPSAENDFLFLPG